MAAADSIPPLHSYYPEGILLSGTNFVPNDLDTVGLVAAFAAGCAVILGSTLLLVKRVNPSLKFTDKALILWFVLSESSWSDVHLERGFPKDMLKE
jgi:cholestenol Delta-isomerase